MATRRGVAMQKNWTSLIPSFQAVSTNTTLLGNAIIPINSQTVLRCRGFVSAQFDATVQVGDIMLLTFGICVVSQDAQAVGATAMPDPFDDASWPGWLWFQLGALHTPIKAITTGAGDPNFPFWQRVDIDTKSMRKLRQNEVLFMNVQVGETAAATMDIRGATRVLAMLP